MKKHNIIDIVNTLFIVITPLCIILWFMLLGGELNITAPEPMKYTVAAIGVASFIGILATEKFDKGE